MKNRFILCVYLSIVAMQSQAQNYITLDGKQFKLNGANFYPVIMNYGVSSQFRTATPNTHYLQNDKDYDMNWFYQCSDQAGCSEDRRRHFRQLKRKGFNTIRIVAHFGFQFENVNGTIQLRLHTDNTFDVIHNSHTLNEVATAISQPYLNNATLIAEWNVWRQIITDASAEDMKVIILPAGLNCYNHPQAFSNSTLRDYKMMNSAISARYTEYLMALATYINNTLPLAEREDILAYEYTNEPIWNFSHWTALPGYNKKDICGFTTDWYNALKTTDPNHLITIGCSGYHDAMLWEQAVMKVDFYSLHLYPEGKVYEPATQRQQYMLDRIRGELWWLSKTMTQPWVVGETGYDAMDGMDYPDNHGTEAQQATYADEMNKYLISYGGSGQGWWQYAQVQWDIPTGTYQNNVANGRFPYHAEDHLGLWRYEPVCNPNCQSTCDQIPATDQAGQDTCYDDYAKPAANVFNRNWYTIPHQSYTFAPGNYYDPENYTLYADQNAIDRTITGAVRDIATNNIENAVVKYYVQQWGNERRDPLTFEIIDTVYGYSQPHTFSNSSGQFTLIPFDYSHKADGTSNNFPIDYISEVADIQISCTGCQRADRGWHYLHSDPPIDGEVFTLQRIPFNYSDVITPANYQLHPVQNGVRRVQAYNDCTLQGVTISGPTSIQARKSITLRHNGAGSPLLITAPGMGVTIRPTETFPICTDFPDNINR